TRPMSAGLAPRFKAYMGMKGTIMFSDPLLQTPSQRLACMAARLGCPSRSGAPRPLILPPPPTLELATVPAPASARRLDPVEPHHRLHVGRVGEEIQRLHLAHPVAEGEEVGQVVPQGLGVARDVDHPLGPGP